MQFVAMPERQDSIFSKADKEKDIKVEASGSIGLFLFDRDKCIPTYPNYTLLPDADHEWCSNISPNKDTKPYIAYSLKGKKMKLTGYSVRNGCCLHRCCCMEDGIIIDGECCCELYSFSLQGSNDNHTWVVLHNVEKDNRIYYCQIKTYEISTTESFKFIRFVQDEAHPGCEYCMQINQIELYGDTYQTYDTYEEVENEENEEAVSIIGKIRRDNE